MIPSNGISVESRHFLGVGRGEGGWVERNIYSLPSYCAFIWKIHRFLLSTEFGMGEIIALH